MAILKITEKPVTNRKTLKRAILESFRTAASDHTNKAYGKEIKESRGALLFDPQAIKEVLERDHQILVRKNILDTVVPLIRELVREGKLEPCCPGWRTSLWALAGGRAGVGGWESAKRTRARPGTTWAGLPY